MNQFPIRFTYTTNDIAYDVFFYVGAHSSRRHKELIKTLDVCSQYTRLPKKITIHMKRERRLRSGDLPRIIGVAYHDRPVIELAKGKLDDLGPTLAHELGHLEHLYLYPASSVYSPLHEKSDWTTQERENYASTLERYFQYALREEPFPHQGLTLSQYISFNKERNIIRDIDCTSSRHLQEVSHA